MKKMFIKRKLLIVLLFVVAFIGGTIAFTSAKKSQAGGGNRTYNGSEVFYVDLGNCGNSWWNNSGCTHRAYFFGNNTNWVTLSNIKNTTIYQAKVPKGSYYGVILARCSTSSTTWSSGKIYNQTGDIMIDSSKNFISYFGGEKSTKATWSNYGVAPTVNPSPTVNPTPSVNPTKTPSPTNIPLPQDIQDGVILHAFNWSYANIQKNLKDIAAAGYTAVQTSPVQQPKDYNSSYTSVGDNWWKLYQPLSLSIAKSSWLGTESDLKSLCKEADKYNVKIICDIVVNHLANDSGPGTTSPSIAQYESQIYNNQGTYFHPYFKTSDDNAYTVCMGSIDMPDLNTSNSYIQDRVISLLKSCIDCGVDGFRFDAAKHIETSKDNGVGSNFWDNVIGSAKSYAKSKGTKLYCYGEILNPVGGGRSYSSYTSNMSITDNKTGDKVLYNVNDKNAAAASDYTFATGELANKLVLWAESHDTYMGGSGSAGIKNTSGINKSTINKAWAIVASRVDAASLYFARPESNKMGSVGSTTWKNSEVVAVNIFHNKFVDSKEWLSSSNSIVMNERYFENSSKKGGAVIVNVNGTSTKVSNMTVNVLKDGDYIDSLTNNKFTVKNGKITGNIGSTGIAVVY
ncbi:MAG: hypothetical protein K6G26_02815 [Lachnospiraceae bacterium]|nr:hypothetical protein [Lachnospiraceae bacterium]